MKKYDFIKRELPLWVLILAPLVYMGVVWEKLPSQLPMHWNVYGNIDGYGPVWGPPLITIVLYLLMLMVLYVDPKKANYQKIAKPYYIMRLALQSFFSIILFITVLAGLQVAIRIEKVIVPLLFVMFMIFGNYMSTLRFNWFVGIKTPWTLSDEDIWRKTHVFAGRLWFWVSIAGLGLSFALTQMALFVFFIVVITAISLIPIIYSYSLYRKKLRETNNKK